MKKKKFDLTADIIDVSTHNEEKTQATHLHNSKNQPTKQVNEMTNLTLRVPKTFLNDYKAWCAKRGITMSQVIQIMYQMYKKEM